MSTQSTSGIPPVLVTDPETGLGPHYIGDVLNWFLMGVLLVQVYIYYQRYHNDRFTLKLLVYTVLILDTVSTFTGANNAWYWLIQNWNNPSSLQTSPWSSAACVIWDALIALIIQIFYAWRIHRVQKSKLVACVCIVIVLLAIAQCVLAIVPSVSFIINPVQGHYVALRPQFAAWLGCSFGADVIITTSMIWILYRQKTENIWSKTDTIFTRLIRNTLQTGLLTSITAGVDIFLIEQYPLATYYMVPTYILGKLYSNSLMATLNSREPHRYIGNVPSSSSGIHFTSFSGIHQGQEDSRPQEVIKVTRTTETRIGDAYAGDHIELKPHLSASELP